MGPHSDMSPTSLVGLLALAASFLFHQAAADCCPDGESSEFCVVFKMLSPMEQAEVISLLGDTCQGDADDAIKSMQKRNPNFLRFGRSGDLQMRLSRSNGPNFLRFGRRDPNFLRFGKASADPNFLRFGKRSGAGDPNFLRFGRQSSFDREARQPNFLRFGRK